MSAEAKRVEVTFTGQQYAQLVREAGKRGMPLAGYIRQRAISEAPADAGDRIGQVLAGMEERLRDEMRLLTRAAVETVASVVFTSAYEAAGRQTTGAQRKACAGEAVRLLDRRREPDAEPLRVARGAD